MERHFAVPVLIAAAIHGGVFFGFPGSATPAPIAKPTTERPVIPLVPPPVPEDPIIVADDEPTPRGTPQPPLPRNQDRVAFAKPEDFTKPVIDAPPVEAGPIDKIPLAPPGSPDGTSEIPRFDIVTRDMLDNAPRVRVQAPLVYPHEAKREGRVGKVTVEFTVDESGRVREPRILESSDRIFEAAALEGVLRWRFEPGRRNGQVVRFRMAVPVHFSLNP